MNTNSVLRCSHLIKFVEFFAINIYKVKDKKKCEKENESLTRLICQNLQSAVKFGVRSRLESSSGKMAVVK
jgi:hypothetical protein